MKLYRQRDLEKAGIYVIKNLVNNKIYIGKSINIYERIRQHINLLNKKSLDENRYLINSWHKHGRENFQYYVLEYLEKDESLIKERELYWMKELDCTNRKIGYNLRIDTATNCIVSKETRELQSFNRRERYKKNPEKWKLVGQKVKEFWINNPERKQEMSVKVSLINTKYEIYQYDKQLNLIKIWKSVMEILGENPNYKKHNIYAVCSGEKPSMYGYIWKKARKEEETNGE